MDRLGKTIDELFALQPPLADDEELTEARAAFRAGSDSLILLKSNLRETLGLAREDAVALSCVLFWMTRRDSERSTLLPISRFLLKVIPNQTTMSTSYFSLKAFEVAERLNSDSYSPRYRQVFHEEQIALLCLGLLPFVQRELLAGKQVIVNFETLIAMSRATKLWAEDSDDEVWNRLRLECRNIMVEWLAKSSQHAFQKSAPHLFRSYHARILCGERSDVLRAGFEQAHFVRRCEIIDQIKSSLDYPQLTVRGYWYHLRSVALKRQILASLKEELDR